MKGKALMCAALIWLTSCGLCISSSLVGLILLLFALLGQGEEGAATVAQQKKLILQNIMRNYHKCAFNLTFSYNG